MQNVYYDLAGGINLASTKTEMGLNTKTIYWADSKNMEIYRNRGIIRQKGNLKILNLPEETAITAIHEMKSDNEESVLLVVTENGNFYACEENDKIILLDRKVTSKIPLFADFLNGTLVAGNKDKMFYIKKYANEYKIFDCNLKKDDETYVYADAITVYKGRIWAAEGGAIYFSALGKFDDFQTENDAGYINNFHTNTDNITALMTYKDYLAVYKEKSVYLLSGSSPDDFSIIPFADKGAYSPKGIVTVNNRQYFYCSGIFTLEVGALNQILLGSEITGNIKEEFNKFDYMRRREVFVLNYEKKNQIWYFIPYSNDKYFHTIWINDIVNKAWYKRVLPQDITSACIYKNFIVTADKNGNLYKEDVNNSFAGEPIEFMWKSPFLGLGDASIRKTIDEFYFVLDESCDNNFKFSVFKNFDSESKDDLEEIYSNNFENLVWDNDNINPTLNNNWSDENNNAIWAIDTECCYKAEISECNYSVQICVEGNRLEQNAAIIGLHFKEIFNED